MPKKLKHYKQARYKAHRKPINKTLLIGIISAIVILVSSIALGAYLGSISAPETDTDTQPEQAPQKVYDAYPKLQVGELSAFALPEVAYESDSEADQAILRANGEMAGALCVRLLLPSGAPSYKSEAYSRIYSAEAKGMDLALFSEKASKSGISLVGVFSMHSLKEENSDIAMTRQSFELSVLAEAYSYGVREVLLTEASAATPEQLFAFMLKLKGLCPELAVGISVSAETARSDSLLCAELDDIFDFLAFEHTSAFAESVSAHDPTLEDGKNDKNDKNDKEDKDDKETDTDTQEPEEPPKSALYVSLESTLVMASRFGARVYIDIGDGCEFCTAEAKNTLQELGVENFMLTLSQAQHKTEEKKD